MCMCLCYISYLIHRRTASKATLFFAPLANTESRLRILLFQKSGIHKYWQPWEICTLLRFNSKSQMTKLENTLFPTDSLLAMASECRCYVKISNATFVAFHVEDSIQISYSSSCKILSVGVIRVYGTAEFEENLSRNTEF